MDMPLVLLNRRRRGAFNPAYLFASAEPGVWYDPSDLTTLFQDNAGATPVTSSGQTVALMLDKSQGLVLGSEISWPASFAAVNALGSNGSYTSATKTFSETVGASTGADWPRFRADSVFVTDKFYKISITFDSASRVSAVNIGSEGSRPLSKSGNTFSGIVQASGTQLWVHLDGRSTPTSASVTSFSMQLLAGNHATQATSAQRPTYGINPITGTRNLLTYTEQFDNAAWVKSQATVTANTAVAPDGTTTADSLTDDAVNQRHIAYQTVAFSANTIYTLSVVMKKVSLRYGFLAIAFGSPSYGVVVDLDTGLVTDTRTNGAISNTGNSVSDLGNGWYRVSVSGSLATGGFTYPLVATSNSATPSYDANGHPTYVGSGQSILIWGAQLEASSTATAYQKVVSQYEVTEAGVQSASYLRFDGVDDGMVTNTITPAIDKVQVFAGVRKLSDATAFATLVEFSATVTSNNGAFLLSGRSAGAAGILFQSKGTSAANSNITTAASPITEVISGIGDIAAPLSKVRVNQVNGAIVTTTQGTGNYLAYPLYIGRRGGTTTPLNMSLYSLITRFGANLTDGQITATEAWVNSKTGAF